MQNWDLGPYFEPFEHYALLRHVVGLASGTALEFGVASGVSTGIIAERMPLIGFDSFSGLPEHWRPDFRAGTFAQPPPEVPNCQLVVGWFEDTVPGFAVPDDVGLLHIDCDLYSSTKTVLDHVGPHLKPGTYIVFDEFWHYDDGPGASWMDHEYRAWKEYADRTGAYWDVIGHSHEAWAIKLKGN